MSRRPVVTAVAVAAFVACAQPSAPSRADFYDWRLPSAGQESFHWPRTRLPVRIWVQSTPGLASLVENGIAVWKAQLLYGEWDAVLVADSATADVQVFGDDVGIPKITRGIMLYHMAPECEGVTGFDPPSDGQLPLPIIVSVSLRVIDPTTDAAQRCLRLTVTHELGHSLGIFQHSPTPSDLMFADPNVTAPSVRDRNTVENLYHFPADLVPAPR